MWVIAIEVIKIARVNGEVILRSKDENDRRIIEIRFIWIPGLFRIRVF